MGRVVAIKDDEDAIIIETGSDRVKMKFKKWCISTVDTVKEQSQQAGQPERKASSVLARRKILTKLKLQKNNFLNECSFPEYICNRIYSGVFYV